MATASVIRSAPLACSSATASMLHSKGRADDAYATLGGGPGSPASDVPDSPMAPSARSSPTLAPPPLEPLKLTPSVRGDRRSTAPTDYTSNEELDTADDTPAVVALPVHATSAAAPPAVTSRRGVRWPNRRGATAGLPSSCDPPRTVAVPLPEPRAMARETEPAVAKPRNIRAKSIRWPARRGASAGLGHTIVASQYSVIDVPVTRER